LLQFVVQLVGQGQAPEIPSNGFITDLLLSSFNALTLLVAWQESIRPVKSPKRSSLGTQRTWINWTPCSYTDSESCYC